MNKLPIGLQNFEGLRRDGYVYVDKTEYIYEKDFGAYWFETGTPTFLVRKILETGFDIRKITGHTLYTSREKLSYFKPDSEDLAPLLYQAGCLTITDYDRRRRCYTLGFPKEEVTYGMLENLLPVNQGTVL